ncbi:MAG: preprotein translocase subunit SecE [Geminocystis sp.]|uniref:Protein translocase subunit SecE n=2 Tax=Cyanobacterium aponinum TaxID=379064 RepID=K9YZH6_CYAAP|nr:protein translocase subunit secE/sec61 gamma [Cyanobacterium aponinum PCC 10605]MTF38004.1 preprotein translocase subunit SecE [Cyanobacterium aponinum 0216]
MTNKDTVKTKNANSNEAQGKEIISSGFVEETKQELAKVVWPSRQQLLSESVAVILMVTVVATLIYLMDKLFGWLAGKVF